MIGNERVKYPQHHFTTPQLSLELRVSSTLLTAHPVEALKSKLPEVSDAIIAILAPKADGEGPFLDEVLGCPWVSRRIIRIASSLHSQLQAVITSNSSTQQCRDTARVFSASPCAFSAPTDSASLLVDVTRCVFFQRLRRPLRLTSHRCSLPSPFTSSNGSCSLSIFLSFSALSFVSRSSSCRRANCSGATFSFPKPELPKRLLPFLPRLDVRFQPYQDRI